MLAERGANYTSRNLKMLLQLCTGSPKRHPRHSPFLENLTGKEQTEEAAFISGWTEFCQLRNVNPSPTLYPHVVFQINIWFMISYLQHEDLPTIPLSSKFLTFNR